MEHPHRHIVPELFNKPSQGLKMDMPNDEEYTWLTDIN